MADKPARSFLFCPRRSLRFAWVAVSLASGMNLFADAPIDIEEAPRQDSASGVYVRDSGVVSEKLALAQRMERLGEWNKSADIYQEILSKLSDRVVPVSAEKDSEQYTGVAMEIHKRLGQWPEAGIKAYNARFDPAAAALLQEATDQSVLPQVFAQYFATDSGRQAGIRLLEADLEAGDFYAAGWTGERLLRLHPNLHVDRPVVLYRTALAFHLAGDPQRAQQWAEELTKQFPNTPGTLHGADVVLAHALQQDRQIAPTTQPITPTQSWPMFGGSPQRNRVGSGSGKPGAKTYAIELHGYDTPRDQQAMVEQRRRSGQMLNIYPVVDRGQMFFQDGRRLYALNGDSNGPLSGWAQTYPGDPTDRGGQYIVKQPGLPTAAQLCVTLTGSAEPGRTDDAVLAIMGQTDRVPITALRGQRTSQLVCLDRQTGRERWVGPKDIPDSQAGLRTAELSGSPLVLGPNVYVVLRNSKGLQFNDSYVACLDLATGKFRWATYIVSSTGQIPMYGDVVATPLTETHLAALGGRLFICADLGAAASLDAVNGQILWLNLYPRDSSDMAQIVNPRMLRRRMVDQQSNFKPWGSNPAIVQDGKLFVLPADGRFLHVYDACTGAQVTRLDLAAFDGADTLLGVVGSKVVFCGNFTVYCVDWKKYQPDATDSRNVSAIVWKKQFYESNSIRGRGFVTTEMVYIPTEKNINCIRMDNGKVEMSYPAGDRTWEEGEGPGNLLVLGEQVIVASERSIVVYRDLNIVKAKLDAEIAAASNDAAAYLHYAEVMDGAGQGELAVVKLDEALTLLKSRATSVPAETRDRAFTDCMLFAGRSRKDLNNDAQVKRAIGMYDRASQIAGQPAQQAQWRLQRAKLAAELRDGALAVQLYQEVLADEAVRSAIVPAESGMSLPAGQVAGRAIDRVIQRVGRGVYDAFDKKAALALEAVRPSADPVKFARVAEEYPNSRSAPSALMLAADAYEANGDARQAITVLRQIYFLYPGAPHTPVVLESMARNYLTMTGRTSSAIARLSQGARLFNNPRLTRPMRLPDGKLISEVTFSTTVDELRKYAARQAPAALADLHLPIPGLGKSISQSRPLVEQAEATIPGVSGILPQADGFSRSDRLVLTMADASLQIFDVGRTTPKMKLDLTGSTPRGCSWISGGLILWTDAQICLLQPDAAAVTWKLDIKRLPMIDAVAGLDTDTVDEARDPNLPPHQVNRRLAIQAAAARQLMLAQPLPPPPNPVNNTGEAFTDVRLISDRVILSSSAGRLACLDLATGKLLWQNRLTDKSIERLVVTEDFSAVKASDESSAHIAVVDNFTGQPVGRRLFSLTSGLLPCNLALSVDGTLVYTLPDRLFIKDLYEPWKNEARRIDPDPTEGPLNLAATAPDQLQVVDGRIILLADDGRFVRVHSLETGKLIRLSGENGQAGESALLSTGAGNWNVTLRIVGSRLYAVAPLTVLSFNLDKTTDTWSHALEVDVQNPRTFSDVTVDANYLVVTDELGNTRNSRRIYAFGRYHADNSPAESGRLDYLQELTHPAGIQATQGVNNGLVYLSGDQKLHFLRTQEPREKN